MEFTYRKAEMTDSQRIGELYKEMLRNVYQAEDADESENGQFDKFFSGSEDLIYVAQFQNEVVAFLAIEVYREAGYVYLNDLSVTEEYRGKGIGTQLIRMAEDYSRSLGIPAIVFHVEKINERAHQLYRKLGYRDNEDQGKRMRMVKDLKNR